ncbi:uncharacterized protein LOC129590323 [Paramacrobiotus metropolitanus]|uniref:uncharacterized protein LOC129590323 n=1 Tax=Paramacrobiotus metropolitanus TaxID=2943436 RepID=UPI002445C79B|nr:uncharacterized protein LOC129590323 [Paramacrobiotus metropolitanus]
MTVCVVATEDPRPSSEVLHFKDVLHLDHSEIDKRCVDIWVQLIGDILNPAYSPASHGEDGALVLQKLMYNYTQLHQLPRLFNKFLQGLRSVPASPHGVDCFSFTLFAELRNAFAQAPESQMASVWDSFLKELLAYVQHMDTAQDRALGGKIKLLARILWILLKHFRIKNTTRQETLQTVWKLHTEMRDTVLEPLQGLCEKLRDDDVVYTCVVLLHAWNDFALILSDRLEISPKSAIKYAKNCSSTMKETTTSERPDLKFWLQSGLIQYYTVSTRLKWTADDLSGFLCWEVLNSATHSAVWDGNVFNITAQSLPVAVWNSICTHYVHLPQEQTTVNDMEFGRHLVRYWLHFQTSPAENTYTLFTVADKFLASGSVRTKPALRAACLKNVEMILRESFDDADCQPTGRKAKKAKREDAQARCRLYGRCLQLYVHLTTSLTIREELVFSMSLLWKAMEFILDNKSNWSQDVHTADNVIFLERLFINAIMSVPAVDAGYWENVLIDYARLRPKLIDTAMRLEHSAALSSCLHLSYAIDVQLVKRIIAQGEAEAVDRAIKSVANVKNVDLNYLPSVFLRVLSPRTNQPHYPALFDKLVPSTVEFFGKCTNAFFVPDGQTTEVEVFLLLQCADTLRIVLTNLYSEEYLKSRFSSLITQLAPNFTTKRANIALNFLGHSSDLVRMETAVKWLCLHMEGTQHCSIKMATSVIQYLTPSLAEIGVHRHSDSSVPLDRGELDSNSYEELFKILLSSVDEMQSATAEPSDHDEELPCVFTLTDHMALFRQMRRFSKPVKFSQVLLDGLSIFRRSPHSESTLLWELTFMRLIISTQLTLETVKQCTELYEAILERLNSVVCYVGTDHRIGSAFMGVLFPLLDSSYALAACTIALSEPVFRLLLNKESSDADFTMHFQNCTLILNEILKQSRLITTQTVPVLMKAISVWLISILQRARQDSDSATARNANRKLVMIRNASFVERLLGNLVRHKRIFSKLVVHLIAVYCLEMQNGTLYPEAKEHITAGLYRLLDMIDPHSKQMGNASIGVESREIYKTLIEEHLRFHKYRGQV